MTKRGTQTPRAKSYPPPVTHTCPSHHHLPQEKLAYVISDLLAKFMLLFVYAAAIK